MGSVQDTGEQVRTAPGMTGTVPDGPIARSAPSETPPPFTVGGALRRHPILMLIPVLLLAGAAVFLGLHRAPTYTAETRMSVGRIDVSTQAIPGVVAAYQSLAGTYSRMVKADAVLDPVAARVGLTSAEVADSVEASPIPESAIIRLKAHASTPDAAVRIANLIGGVLTRYVDQVNQSGDSDGLLERFRAAAAELADAQQARDAAQRAEERSASEESRQALSKATADYEVANIRVTTIRDRISQEAQGRATTQAIQSLNLATEAVSDRGPVMQRLVLVGILAGLMLGTLLAITRERSKRRRATV